MHAGKYYGHDTRKDSISKNNSLLHSLKHAQADKSPAHENQISFLYS